MTSTSGFHLWRPAPEQQQPAESTSSSTRSSFEDFRPLERRFDAVDAAELLTRLQHAHYPEPEPAAKPPAGRGKRGKSTETKVCMDCGTVHTPFWRRDKETRRPLCNACGLYLAKHKFHRTAKRDK